MSRQALDQAFEFEHGEGGHDLAGGHAGAADQIMVGGWMIVPVTQERSLRVGQRKFNRMADR